MEEVKEPNKQRMPEEFRQALLGLADINMSLANFFQALAESEVKLLTQQEALIAEFRTHKKI